MNARLVLLVSGAALLAGPALAHTPAHHAAHSAPALAAAAIAAADGTNAGSARIVADKAGLKLVVSVKGLPAGVHGIHLHAAGQCDGPGFTTAGAHLNPSHRQHGLENPAGAHLGDLPNLTVAADGTGSLNAPLSGSRDALTQALFDADGTAIVIHAAPDDNHTDPSGNSGGRIACGVFKQGG